MANAGLCDLFEGGLYKKGFIKGEFTCGERAARRIEAATREGIDAPGCERLASTFFYISDLRSPPGFVWNRSV